jgi:hypothetical protein
VTFLLYQWMLGISALRAVYRELEVQLGWEKTHHAGAHRRDRPSMALRPSPLGIMNTIGHASPAVSPVAAPSGDVRHCVRCGVARSWRELVCPACGAGSARASWLY